MHLLYVGARDFIKFPSGSSLTTIGFDADDTANLVSSRDICVCLGSEDSTDPNVLFVTKHPEWSSVFEPNTQFFDRLFLTISIFGKLMLLHHYLLEIDNYFLH